MMSDLMPEVALQKQIIFEGKMISLRLDRVRLQNGQETTREIVQHPGAVAILATTDQDKVVLVRQYRYAIGQFTLELPAGKLEAGEDPQQAALRELAEETGYNAREVHHALTFYSTPGFSDEMMHLYEAHHLVDGAQHTDDDEFVDCLVASRAEVSSWITQGKIVDAKTLVGLYRWLAK